MREMEEALLNHSTWKLELEILIKALDILSACALVLDILVFDILILGPTRTRYDWRRCRRCEKDNYSEYIYTVLAVVLG